MTSSLPLASSFDFAALHSGMKRANVDLMGITLQATVEVKGEKVVLSPTAQELPLQGPPPSGAGPAPRTMRVLEWTDPARTRVQVLP